MSDGSLDRLLVVQDLDTLITQLTHRRAALAERVGLVALDVELGALAAEEAGLVARRHELVATQKDLEAQIAVADQRRTGIEQRMYAARGSSTRDLQAMDEEVRHLNQRRSELEDEELVAMVDQEPIDAALAALAAKKAPIEEKATILRAEVAQGQAEIDGELEAARRGTGERGGGSSRPLCPSATKRCGPASRGPGRPDWSATGAAVATWNCPRWKSIASGPCPPTPWSPATSAGAFWSRPDSAGAGMLILVRHGESSANAQGLLVGRSDVELTEKGRAQAVSVRRLLHGPVRSLRTSPLRRARDTAAALALDVPAEVDRALDRGGLRRVRLPTPGRRSRRGVARVATQPGLPAAGWRDAGRGRRQGQRRL